MENGTYPPYFNLTMFVNIGIYRYPAFVLCLLLYAVIIFANLVIIVVISREKVLHEPIFLRDLLSDTHLIPRSACFIQIYVIYTYASYEYYF
ncbi:hypothetical protein F7725_001741 [Dissostichus mawsoni]|uniref:G-protein coupled receptors family 1 profile domain-containing protein n=1 Tax=Dissostichus mawsoni TaxID=36200 RepID=A0A7J5Y0G2_DISMA|nr:hypothetical protein F7725_001741 [Dissostichus mawsoni]